MILSVFLVSNANHCRVNQHQRTNQQHYHLCNMTNRTLKELSSVENSSIDRQVLFSSVTTITDVPFLSSYPSQIDHTSLLSSIFENLSY